MREPHEARRYRNGIEAAFRRTLHMVRWRASFFATAMSAGYIGVAAVVWLGGRALIAGQLTPGAFLSFFLYTFIVVGALAVVVVLSVCAKELDEDMHVQGHEHRLALVVGTPAEGRMQEDTPHRPLHRAQRINLLLVMAVAQVLQAVFFAALFSTGGARGLDWLLYVPPFTPFMLLLGSHGPQAQVAALSGLGPKSRKQTGIASAGTRALVEAAAGTGMRRLIAISAMPVGGPIEGDSLLLRRVLRPMLHALLRDAYADLAAMEALLAASDLEWTVLRAPRLTDGPRTQRLRTKTGGSLPGAGTISRADLAYAMLEAVTDRTMLRQVVGVASAR